MDWKRPWNNNWKNRLAVGPLPLKDPLSPILPHDSTSYNPS
jgi:hypothetical protein